MPWRKQPAWQRRALEQAYADRTRQEVERDKSQVAALNAIVGELDSDRKQRDTADAKRERREWWTVAGLFLTAVIALGGLAASIYQVHLTRTALDDARANFTRQTSNTQESLALTKQAADAVTKQADLLRESNDTAKETLLAGSRAWIGIQSASSAAPKAGSDLDVDVAYNNPGRQPALNLSYHADAFIVAPQDTTKASARVDAFIKTCSSMKQQNQGIAYPTTGFNAYSLHLHIAKERITKEVIERGDLFSVAGCFSYQTFNATHHSSFCMFFFPKTSKPESWNFCGNGNDAD
jgi:hypothetical protein